MTDAMDASFGGAAFDAAGADGASALTDRELSFLREAGVPIGQLTPSDVAAIKMALFSDNTLFEDAGAGNVLAMSASPGTLRDMLTITKQEMQDEQNPLRKEEIKKQKIEQEEKEIKALEELGKLQDPRPQAEQATPLDSGTTPQDLLVNKLLLQEERDLQLGRDQHRREKALEEREEIKDIEVLRTFLDKRRDQQEQDSQREVEEKGTQCTVALQTAALTWIVHVAVDQQETVG